MIDVVADNQGRVRSVPQPPVLPESQLKKGRWRASRRSEKGQESVDLAPRGGRTRSMRKQRRATDLEESESSDNDNEESGSLHSDCAEDPESGGVVLLRKITCDIDGVIFFETLWDNGRLVDYNADVMSQVKLRGSQSNPSAHIKVTTS